MKHLGLKDYAHLHTSVLVDEDDVVGPGDDDAWRRAQTLRFRKSWAFLSQPTAPQRLLTALFVLRPCCFLIGNYFERSERASFDRGILDFCL
eukprot:5794503-Alexandrium_andersonii.AAC.1